MALTFELLDCIEFWARHRGNVLAVSSSTCSFSYSELLAALDDLCSSVLSADSNRIAVLASTKLATAVGVLSTSRCGCSCVVLNPHLPPELMKTCIEEARPEAILVAQEDEQAWKAVIERYETIAALRCVRFSPSSVRRGVPQRQRPKPQPDREWAVLYSSGSTGTPKGIERDFESMHTEFLGWCLELGLGTHSRFYVGRPVYYTGGLVLTMSTLLAGGSVVLNEVAGETAEALVNDIVSTAQSGPLDWAFLVPDQVRLLLQSDATRELEGCLKAVLVMGAPISGREKQCLARLLRCIVRESWGNSESLGTITDDEMLRECPDSIGRPFLGDRMCVVDDDGNECPTGEVGRLAGGQLAGFTRYTERPTDTAKTKRNNLIISEDLGWCDDKGRFFIGGRVQEYVRVGDQHVFLPKLEEDLRAHGLVVAFCLTHRTIDDLVEIGLVFESGTTTESQVRMCLDQVSTPLSIARITVVRALPRTASGKVDRASASSLLWPTI